MRIKKRFIYLLFIFCLFMTGCGDDKTKTVATLEQFTDITTNKGFVVNDIMNIYENYDYILEAKKAIYEDVEIEMVKYTDSSYADKAQENHIDSFDLLKNTGAHSKKDKGDNYYSYSLVSNGRYMVSTRVDNTLIFFKIMLEDKDLVDEILNQLGY